VTPTASAKFFFEIPSALIAITAFVECLVRKV
jgi:hypothetical protein